jgi:acyl-CoA ligase (AMP-forming) (exosortase A-associated)
MRSQVHHLISRTSGAGGAPALTAGDTTLDYDRLAELVDRTGAGLQRLGVGRGDRVAVYLDKRVETVAAVFGTSAAGGAFVPVNPLLRPRQVAHIVQDSGARVLVTTPQRLDQLRTELADTPTLEHVVLVGSTAPAEDVAPYRVSDWGALLSTAPAHPCERGVVDVDMAAILYTSGSTGPPKGVVVSHRNLISGAESVSDYLGNGPRDVILAALPLSFDAGFSQLTTAFSSGAHVVLINYLLPRDIVRACERHGVTGLTCVPPLWLQLCEQAWPEDVARRLRYFANTGGRMPRATLDALRAIFSDARPFLMYGLTEAFRSTYLDPSEVDRRPDSIGKAIPNAEILVVRPDGTECTSGEEGELVHRGALVSLGYWNNPEATEARFRPAPGRDPSLCNTEIAVWSGDAVVRDEEGFLYFVGRKDEMIKTSGYRVSPTEVEEVAYATGMVRDAVALGVDDPAIGQAVVLAASPAVGTELDVPALLAAMRRELPLYMVPRSVVVHDQLPRSPNGKFDRNLLRQEITA